MPAISEYPPIGVPVNVSESDSSHNDEPVRYRDLRLLQSLNAPPPIKVHAGKLTVVRFLHCSNAYQSIVVATGKFTDAKE